MFSLTAIVALLSAVAAVLGGVAAVRRNLRGVRGKRPRKSLPPPAAPPALPPPPPARAPPPSSPGARGPLRSLAAHEAQASAEAYLAVSRAEAFKRPQTVLVVDDDPGIRGVFRRIASQLDDLEFLEADTLAVARVQVAVALPDLILIDAHLPDGYGWTLARDLPRTGVEVVLMSGLLDPETLGELADDVQAWKVVQKPLHLRELERLLYEGLGRELPEE